FLLGVGRAGELLAERFDDGLGGSLQRFGLVVGNLQPCAGVCACLVVVLAALDRGVAWSFRDPLDRTHGPLTEAGLSTRAIAPVVGASQKTVSRDAQVSHMTHPTQTPAPVPSGEAATDGGFLDGYRREEGARCVRDNFGSM